MVNRKLAKVIIFRYRIVATILIILALGLVFLPKYEKQEGINPEELLSNSISNERYLSTDEVAHLLITNDISYLFIDVRDETSFKNFSLPKAINIPLKKLFEKENEIYLNQDQYDLVLFSNDNFYADQAWLLLNRLGKKNIHVLKGGINEWYKTIINPTLPADNQSAKEFELYSTRKAASMYFGVVYPEPITIVEEKPEIVVNIPRAVVPVKKEKMVPTEGGC